MRRQLAVSPFPERRFPPQESAAACGSQAVCVLPCGGMSERLPSSDACTRLPVFSEVIQLKLPAFSIHLSVKFRSVAGEQRPASPQTSPGSRRVGASCRGARLTTTFVIRGVVESERRMWESCQKSPREHESLRNPVLNKNLWAFLLHASLFLTDYLWTRTQNRDSDAPL